MDLERQTLRHGIARTRIKDRLRLFQAVRFGALGVWVFGFLSLGVWASARNAGERCRPRSVQEPEKQLAAGLELGGGGRITEGPCGRLSILHPKEVSYLKSLALPVLSAVLGLKMSGLSFETGIDGGGACRKLRNGKQSAG